MDSQRHQAYLELIQALLKSPRGQEIKILQADRELVDQGLVQVMLQQAASLTALKRHRQGNRDNHQIHNFFSTSRQIYMMHQVQQRSTKQ